MVERLDIKLYDQQVGVLEKTHDGPVLIYDEDWIAAAQAGKGHALSISLPITRREYGPRETTAFLAGLLPDSEAHRREIARLFGREDANDYFELLRAIGRDCAGAVVFTDAADQYAAIRERPGLLKMDEAELAERLRNLPRAPLMDDPDVGTRISLAGAQAKMAVVVTGGAVALPINGFPSSHILKIDIPLLPDSIRTEHFCLRLAKACNINVPKSSLHQAEDIVYMRIGRYDRRQQIKADGRSTLHRVHQEDLCQAMGVHPEFKYENRGGPSWRDFAGLMRYMHSPAVDQAGMLDRALFQYLSGNPDAHGKNYSIRYTPRGEMGLSPLYDLNNQACLAKHYQSIMPRMAMGVGRKRGSDNPVAREDYRPNITRDHWVEFANDIGMPASHVLRKLDEMATRISSAVESLREEARHRIDDTPLLDAIKEDIQGRADAVLRGVPEPPLPNQRPDRPQNWTAGPRL
jgi:serine/threonine-protein kinase HipA